MKRGIPALSTFHNFHKLYAKAASAKEGEESRMAPGIRGFPQPNSLPGVLYADEPSADGIFNESCVSSRTNCTCPEVEVFP